MAKATPKPVRTKMTEHFSREEFCCKCGCGQNNIRISIVSALETIRLIVDQPITVTSGYRCPEHNAKVGGAKASEHVLGLAADITSPAGYKRLYEAALRVPAVRGIGLYPAEGFVHIDTRTTSDHVAKWARINGKYVGIVEALS